MKVRMLVGQAGASFVRDPGKEYDVGSDEAKRLIESGQAVPVKQDRQVETATARKQPKKGK